MMFLIHNSHYDVEYIWMLLMFDGDEQKFCRTNALNRIKNRGEKQPKALTITVT